MVLGIGVPPKLLASAEEVIEWVRGRQAGAVAHSLAT
jgi:hypothetical protein